MIFTKNKHYEIINFVYNIIVKFKNTKPKLLELCPYHLLRSPVDVWYKL